MAAKTVRSNAAAARLTVQILEASGAVEKADDALKTAVLRIAEAVDAKPGDAGLWREYRALLQALKETAAGGTDDDQAAFVVAVRTPMVNAKKSRAADVRSRDRGGV